MADPSYLSAGTLTEGEAWVAIETTTLSGAAEYIGFTSGTGTKNWSQYEHLQLVCSLRSTSSYNADYVRLMINSQSVVTSGYASQGLWATNATVVAGGSPSTTQGFMGYTVGGGRAANIFSTHICTLFDINSGKYKTSMSRGASVSDGEGYSDVWNSIRYTQDPVSSLYVSMYPTGSDDFAIGSSVNLFGLLPKMVV